MIVYFDFDSLWMAAKYMGSVLYCYDCKTNQIIIRELFDDYSATEKSMLSCCCQSPTETELRSFVDEVVIYGR